MIRRDSSGHNSPARPFASPLRLGFVPGDPSGAPSRSCQFLSSDAFCGRVWTRRGCSPSLLPPTIPPPAFTSSGKTLRASARCKGSSVLVLGRYRSSENSRGSPSAQSTARRGAKPTMWSYWILRTAVGASPRESRTTRCLSSCSLRLQDATFVFYVAMTRARIGVLLCRRQAIRGTGVAEERGRLFICSDDPAHRIPRRNGT